MNGYDKTVALAVVVVMLAVCSVTMLPGDVDGATVSWDGTTDIGWYVETESTFVLDTPEQLAGLAQLVNGGNDFSGKTVVLKADTVFDLSGHAWTPIGNGTIVSGTIQSGSTSFSGKFDGNGCTVSGLQITSGSSDQPLGLFGIVAGGEVSNLHMEEVTLKAGDPAGVVAGALYDGGRISGCIVGLASADSCVVDTSGDVGGIVGKVYRSGTVEGCYNYVDITSVSGKVGGIASAAYYQNNGMFITGCENYGDITSGAGYSGGIVGLASATIDGCKNYGDVEANQTGVGGIVGEIQASSVVKKCYNEGYVFNGCSSDDEKSGYGTGGIVGWSRYSDQANYGKMANVIENCTNKGNVSSKAVGAGGIIGMVYHGITITGCTSDAEVSGKNMVGGIVGGVQGDANHSDSCYVRIEGNESSGTVGFCDGTSPNIGKTVGHLLTTISGKDEACSPVNGSRSVVFNNTSTVTGTDVDVGGNGPTSVIVTINGINYGYYSINTAITENSGELHITLNGDVTEAVTIPADSDVTLDLNGYTLRNVDMPQFDGSSASSDRHHTITNNGILTVIDSGVDGTIDNLSHGKAAVYNSGTFTLTSGTLTRSEEASVNAQDDGDNSWYVLYNEGTFYMNGGTIYMKGNYSSLVINKSETGSKPVMVMTDGTLSQEGFISLRILPEATVTIKGGIIESGNQSIQNYGTVSIEGGDITGSLTTIVDVSDTVVQNASTTISDGTINGTIRAWTYPSNTEAEDAMSIVIEGGTINAKLEDVYGPGNGVLDPYPVSETSISVKGGTFNSDVKDYCAEGFICESNGNGTFGVVDTNDADITSDNTSIEIPAGQDTVVSDGTYDGVEITYRGDLGTVVVIGTVNAGSVKVLMGLSQTPQNPDAALAIDLEFVNIVPTRTTVTVFIDVDEGMYLSDCVIWWYDEGESGSISPIYVGRDGTVTFETDHNTEYDFKATFEPIGGSPVGPNPPQGSDDDDEYVPPSYIIDQSSGSSDTTTVVACAAAAVVAALMAAFLIMEYRRK